jgi:hypothetical protein
VPRLAVVVVACALCGCAGWPWSADDTPAQPDAAGGGFSITTNGGRDPRAQADDICAAAGRIAHLTTAERVGSNDPGDDRIVWHFLCVY